MFVPGFEQVTQVILLNSAMRSCERGGRWQQALQLLDVGFGERQLRPDEVSREPQERWGVGGRGGRGWSGGGEWRRVEGWGKKCRKGWS